MSARVLAAAVAYDVALGELPAAGHPVIALGWVIEKVAGRPRRDVVGFVRGAAATIAVMTSAWTLGVVVERIRPKAARAVIETWLLKSSFALRPLFEAATRVGARLDAGDLPEARAELRWLVSRDRSSLDLEHATSAAIESIAENLSDSFVAPLLAYRLVGLRGALAYRAINTADAMLGYRGEYEYLGKVAARVDDLVNLVPARATAASMCLAAFVLNRSHGACIWTVLRDAPALESPNAGWPIAAAAGALGIWLEKPTSYRLGDGPAPKPHDIARAVRLCAVAAAVLR